MAYDDAIEREIADRMHRWQQASWSRELLERHLPPDERLDEVGWEIFSAAIRGMSAHEAAVLAMDGTLRKRKLIRDDLQGSEMRELLHRLRELESTRSRQLPWGSTASDQLGFWRDTLPNPSFVYFIQHGDGGPVKIGRSREPDKRIGDLQTGNPRELHLRHVIPGDIRVEKELHRRFWPARIRREWFGGPEYLAMIVAFASGLADEMLHAYDGSGEAPRLRYGEVRTPSEIDRMRRDIERLWGNWHSIDEIARLLRLQREEVEDQLALMNESTIHHTRFEEWVCRDGEFLTPEELAARQRA